jgi:hypothetical protein
MKTCHKCNILKSKEEFYKQSTSKDGLHSWCKICKNLDVQSRRIANPEHRKEIQAKYREAHIDNCRKMVANWRKQNPYKHAAKEAKRRALKLNATPAWADLKKIEEIYRNCPKGFHVDHVIPLNGKDICGLHVPENLQYLPAIENIKKGNRFVNG